MFYVIVEWDCGDNTAIESFGTDNELIDFINEINDGHETPDFTVIKGQEVKVKQTTTFTIDGEDVSKPEFPLEILSKQEFWTTG